MKKTTKNPKVNPQLKKKSKKKTLKKKSVQKYEHHPDHGNTSEAFLIQNLDEDLKEAWFRIREFASSLGEQRIYASGKAIMFSKKVCYFFVRPQKSYLEVVIFLKTKKSLEYFKAIKPVSKTKFAHTFRLIHSDQIEGELVDSISEAYQQTPAADL